MSIVGTAREYIALLDELADIDWRRPAWWGLVAGATLLETTARGGGAPQYPAYLAVNGGPRADTLMVRSGPAPASRAERLAVAIARARAAAAAIRAVDGEFPDQPLACSLRWRRGLLAREPASIEHAAFLVPHGTYVGALADDDRTLAGATAAPCLGPRPHPPSRLAPVAR